MALGLHVFPNMSDFALSIDEKGGAGDAVKGPAQELFESPDSVSLEHLVGRIAQQGKVQFLFDTESEKSFFRIGAGAQDRGTQFFELLLCVTKLGRFGGSTGSIGFRVEEEHNLFAAKIGKGQIRALVGLQTKFRCLIADFKHIFLRQSGAAEQFMIAISAECR